MKNKPLEVYERLDDYCCLNVNRSKNPFEDTEYKSVDDLVDDLEALKKCLAALAVLKLVLNFGTNREIIRKTYEAGWITEEQFNLLKEVLL